MSLKPQRQQGLPEEVQPQNYSPIQDVHDDLGLSDKTTDDHVEYSNPKNTHSSCQDKST